MYLTKLVFTSEAVCELRFLFLNIRRPANSPLFPYTTLFRSHSDHRELSRRRPRSRSRSASRHGLRPRSGDRKSTRLNSSHVEISYAVFCLKKKKKIPSIIICYMTCTRHHLTNLIESEQRCPS